MTKTCNGCKRTLPLSEFHKKACGLHGVNGRCKDCIRGIENTNRRAKDAEQRSGPMYTDKRLLPGYTRAETQTGRAGCSACEHEDTCNQRVRMAMWVMCERPDYADLRRAKWSNLTPELLTEIHNYDSVLA